VEKTLYKRLEKEKFLVVAELQAIEMRKIFSHSGMHFVIGGLANDFSDNESDSSTMDLDSDDYEDAADFESSEKDD